MLDVGQGDALVIRTPDARWIVVDAGPAGRGRDAGADVVLPFLARRGVRRLERVYFTHPDLDHIGGGPVLLSSLPVGVVSDPGLVEGKISYVTLLETADHQGIPWETARPGSVWSGGGVTLRVLAPLPVPLGAGAFANDTDANAASIVLSLEYGEFRMLLTGDAPDDMEAAMGATQPPWLAPKTPMRSALIAGCAVIMWLIRAMLVGDFFWAKCLGAILATVASCFLTYTGLFLLAHLFTIVSSPLVDAIDSDLDVLVVECTSFRKRTGR